MDNNACLTQQVKTVINILEKEYSNEITKGTLQLIYNRYKDGLKIMESNGDLKNINIIGGVRAYMDSYNDYQNPLLKELHKAEKTLEELI
ncbi:hypothetical protein LCM20_16600 [Halobacillus litoralis]|uniref:hypothetical protein n=1 Tax=Halobacillus litoralis TaxID=45668 RepID=UPI001CD2CE67|nr:hypothetical protein [Halobacillus litoralis]MCA0972230.1 hypothetical protein [Halobacillus litoralis]